MSYFHPSCDPGHKGYGTASVYRAENEGPMGIIGSDRLPIVTDRLLNYVELKGLFDTTAIDSTESVGLVGRIIAHERLPTDPIYVANLTLQNVSGGSRYWVANAANLSQVLATGTVAGSEDLSYDEVIPSVPAYSSNFLLEIRVRNASGVIKYQPFKTFIPHSVAGASAYVIQTQDTVA